MVYEKDIKNATFTGNLSPLHWENAKAVIVDDNQLLSSMQEFINPLNNRFGITFCGLDLALDYQNKLWLLEINSSPTFSLFVRDNGESKVIDLYQLILSDLSSSP